ncbi:lyase family protein [Leifsonia sp. NCR5]|uniref:lyase family protein n=1 Tax=Leifsonia sp. NCR5 TaxID=1978342 RepID=UPI000A18D4C6|nr:lyase family protein [Leifsonia sp. NCR5]
MTDGDVGILDPAVAASGGAALCTDLAVVQAMLDTEFAWAQVLVEHGVGDAAWLPAIEDACAVELYHLAAIAADAAGGGNALIPVLARLRATTAERSPEAAAFLHLGATSQDIVDTALMLVATRTLTAAASALDATADALVALVGEHRSTLMVARTLAQHSLPSTFALKAAHWLAGITAARSRMGALLPKLPLQWGGAAGTLASLDTLRGVDTLALVDALAARLGLAAPVAPWQTNRWPVLRAGGAAAEAVAACAVIGADVALLSRPEFGELSEPRADGRGVSSAMPQKQNPVLSVLLKREGLRVGLDLGALTAAAAATVDERSDGGWHAEWTPLRSLVRSAAVSAELAAELAGGLGVHPERMRQNLGLAGPVLLSERVVAVLGRALADRGDHDGPRDVRAAMTAARDAATGDTGDTGAIERSLLATLGADRLAAALGGTTLSDLLDPAGYLGRADDFCVRIVAEATTRTPLGKEPRA